MCGLEIDIVHKRASRLYCTWEGRQIISYKQELRDRIVHGLRCKEERKDMDKAVWCICMLSEVRLRCNSKEGAEGGGGSAISQEVVHPPFVCYACLGEWDTRGGGLCHAPAFPCLVGAWMSPCLCINRGVKGGVAGGPALGVLFNLSRDKGGKGGGLPLCTALHSLFAHRNGVVPTPCRGGGGIVCSLPCISCKGGGHQQGLHKSGRGNANCVFAFPHPLFTPLFTCHIACKGRGCQQWVKEGGRVGGVAVPLLPMHLGYMSHVCVVFIVCILLLR